MSSGLYSAMSGAMARMKLMDTISDNLSNVKTVGFKRGQDAFAGILEQAQTGREIKGINFTEIKQGFTDFDQGMFNRTGVSTHLGIEGEGFFKVRDDNGNEFYTRQGNFHVDRVGNLKTASGMDVIGDDRRPILLPRSNVEIDERGMANLGNGELKKIPLFQFEDKSQLARRGNGLFIPVSEDVTPKIVEEPRIYQGQLEEANVNMMIEMARMMEANRAFEACQRMMKTFDDLSSKANDIGLVG